MAARGSTPGDRRAFGIGSVSAVGVAAVALIALAAWRSTLGMTFADDSYYVAATLRLAQGARLFVDEMFLQSSGLLVAVPFTKLWIALFSTTGLAVALRLFYVAVASLVGLAVYRALRPTFGPWPALLAGAAILLAPAYNLLAVSYDTMAAAGMVLACVWAFAALRDGSLRSAVAAGAAAAFASVSYPPLALAAIALLAVFWWLGRGRRLVLPMLAGAAVVVAAFLLWLATQASLADLRATAECILDVGRASGPLRPGGRMGAALDSLYHTLIRTTWGVPIWVWFGPAAVISVATASPATRAPERARARGWLLAALPLALALPLVANVVGPPAQRLWTFGGNYLIGFVFFAAIPLLAGLRDLPEQMRNLVFLALPTGLVGFLVVNALTSASLYRASGIVGLAPLAAAVAVWWAATVGASIGPAGGRAAALALLAMVVVCLFGATFDDRAPLTLDSRIGSGAYAGVTTTAANENAVAAIGDMSLRWARPTDGVLFIDYPGGYLALRSGVALTPATWLNYGCADGVAVDHFDRVGRWPAIVFVETRVFAALTGPGATRSADPLLYDLTRRYRVVETSAVTGLTVLLAR